MAVRSALGATRWRLVRQLVIEHVVLAACGGVLGIGVGYAMLKGIQSLIPPSTLPPAVDVGMDASVLLFTLAAAVSTGLLFGIAPAAQITKPSLVSGRKEHRRGTTIGRIPT
jgi:putative ABC transport system permease protein